MIIFEEFLQSKTGRTEDCEDSIFRDNKYIAVIDGATSKSNFSHNNKTSGKIAAQIIKKSLGTLSQKCTAIEAIKIITSDIHNFYIANSLENNVINSPESRLTASVIIYSSYRKEVWAVGDCQGIVNENYFCNKKTVDKILANVRSLYIDIEFQKGRNIMEFQEFDDSREFIKPLLKAQSFLQNNQNSEYGYAIIDGFDIDNKNITIIKVTESNEIILASDGYPVLQRTLEQSEKKLKSILSEDPLLCKKYKSTKGVMRGHISFDDRSYIRFSDKN